MSTFEFSISPGDGGETFAILYENETFSKAIVNVYKRRVAIVYLIDTTSGTIRIAPQDELNAALAELAIKYPMEHAPMDEMDGAISGGDVSMTHNSSDPRLATIKQTLSRLGFHLDKNQLDRIHRLYIWADEDPKAAHRIIEIASKFLTPAAEHVLTRLIYATNYDPVMLPSSAVRKIAGGGVRAKDDGSALADYGALDSKPGDEYQQQEPLQRIYQIPPDSRLMFFPTPSSKNPFFTMMVSGSTGSGKSVFMATFLELYLRTWSASFFFIGFHGDDPAYSKIRKHIHVVDLSSITAVENSTTQLFNIDAFRPPAGKDQTVLIFDDAEMGSEEVRKSIALFRDFCFRNGRKLGISTMAAYHVVAGGVDTKTSRIECSYKVIFLAGPGMQLLRKYLALWGYAIKHQQKIQYFCRNYRFVCIHEAVPTVFLTPGFLAFL